MQIPTFMEMGQGSTQVQDGLNGVWRRHLTVGGGVDQGQQRRAMEIFLEEKRATVMGTLPKDMDDVRMGHPSEQRGFAFEGPGCFRGGRKLGQDDFTRQGTEIRRAPDLVELRQAAGAEMPDHGQVAANAGPKRKRIPWRKSRAPSGHLSSCG